MVTKKEAENSSFVYVKDGRTGEIKRIAFPQDVQIGLASSPSELMLTGRFSLSAVKYAIRPGGTLALKNDVVYALIEPETTGTGDLNVVLPSSPRQGQLVIIKDSSGTADVNNIVVKTKNTDLIDTESQQLITSQFGSISLTWNGAGWTGVFGQGGGSTPSGADERVQFSSKGKLSSDSSFTFDKVKKALTVPSLSGSLTRLSNGQPYLQAGTNVTLTTSSLGYITISAPSVGGAPTNASYITLGTNTTLSDERVITPSTGLNGLDGGAGGNYTLSIDDAVVATVSGTTFTGVTYHTAGLSGSLTRLTNNDPYLLAGSGITLSTGSSGQVTITNSGALQTIEWNERLTGTVDGTNTSFSLAYSPTTSLTLMLFLNGILLEQGVGNDFTISGTTVTMSQAPLPESKLTATYSR
jgi:hypothetical protein